MKYFLLAGSQHTMLFEQFSIASPTTSTSPSTRINDWLTAWHDGTPAWRSVDP